MNHANVHVTKYANEKGGCLWEGCGGLQALCCRGFFLPSGIKYVCPELGWVRKYMSKYLKIKMQNKLYL